MIDPQGGEVLFTDDNNHRLAFVAALLEFH